MAEKESTLGAAVREMRKKSPYKDLRAFGKRAGVSHEGLRKIEIGKNVPTLTTLERLIKVGRPPKEIAERMRRDRDRAQVNSAGLSRSPFRSEERMEQFCKKLTTVAESFLYECEIDMGERERRALYKRFMKAVREEIRD